MKRRRFPVVVVGRRCKVEATKKRRKKEKKKDFESKTFCSSLERRLKEKVGVADTLDNVCVCVYIYMKKNMKY